MASSRGASRFWVTRETRLMGAATDVPDRSRMDSSCSKLMPPLPLAISGCISAPDPALAWTRTS